MADEDDDDEIPAVRLHPALIASCFLTLAKDLTAAVSEFFEAGAYLLAAHFKYGAERRDMHDEATREIESLTQGE